VIVIVNEIDIGHNLFDAVSLRGRNVMGGAIGIDRSTGARRLEFNEAVLKLLSSVYR